MDSDSVDPRIFMRDYACDPVQRISITNGGNNKAGSRSSSIRNSVNPNVSEDALYNRQISKSLSTNNEMPIELIRLKGIEEASVPLQRRKSSYKLKQINHKKRSCTDVQCLIIFVIFIAAWVYTANYAFSKGDLNNVLVPTDSKNIKCGLDSGVRDKKMLFFFNLDKCLDPMIPITGCNTKQICVESCPQNAFIWQEAKVGQTANLHFVKENLICDFAFDKSSLKNFNEVEKAIDKDQCSGWYLKSKPFFNHCVWDFSENVCNILPKMLTGRMRRSALNSSNFIDITSLENKFAEFVGRMKLMCAKQNHREPTLSNMVAIKGKLEQSQSNFNRIITAMIPKFNYNGKEIVAEHISTDIKNSWKVLMIAFVVHLFGVLLFITLLRWLATPLVWLSINGVIICMTFAFVYSFKQYRFWSKEPHVPYHAHTLQAKFQNCLETGDVWLYITIFLGVLLTVILLLVLAIRKRIRIGIAIIKEASKAIMNIKSSIFFPIFPGILYIFIAALSIVIMLYLSSIGEFSFKVVHRNDSSKDYIEDCVCTGPTSKPYNLGDICEPASFEEFCHIKNDVSKQPCVQTSCSFNEIVKSSKTRWFMVFHIFGFLWVTFFISAYEDMVLACTFSIWYWTFNKKNIPKLPLMKAIWITTFYHMGTLAFGSLILSICRMITHILELIEKKIKLYNNAITRTILCCMQCFFWLLEKFLRFLNKNAYITCAIHSTNFCESSKKSFNLITQNILRVYAIGKVSNFLFFLSKLLVTGCTSCVTYFFLRTYPTIIPINYPMVPLALVTVVTYIMAHFIFSTYSMAVDTLFFCFLEDSTENDGSAENPFYMSKELRKLLGKSNRRKLLEKR